ncbi:MAG TPA: ATP-binding protein [Gemmatimonadaceae bacterium]
MVQDAPRILPAPALTSRESERGSRWTWWAIATGAALLAASQWLNASSVEYLVLFLIATAGAVVASAMMWGTGRWWARTCAGFLAIAGAFSVAAQHDLWRLDNDWDAWRHETVVRGLATMKRELDESTRRSIASAGAALTASNDRTQAFDDLASLTSSEDETGVVLYRADTALAWAGTIRPPVDLSREGTSVIATAFYLALQVVIRQDDKRAVDVALLAALPPADRLSSPLARRVAQQTELAGFDFTPASDSAGPEVLTYQIGNVPLFDVRAKPLVKEGVQQQITERVRVRAGLAFLLALAFFIIGVWRSTAALPQRVAALATALACTALVPLNKYSNFTRLFDPAVYFTPQGGPLTSNAGALLMTGVIILLGILVVFRQQAWRRSKIGAVATVLLVAGLGPFLLRELARGVTIPLRGVDTTLWVIWQLPLFLAGVAVMLTGAAAGAVILGPRRGLAPWVAPLLATIAAALAPIEWEPPGRWPWWYTILWVAAIAMLAFSRRSRRVILSASTVAALGAVTLVWGRTARGRVDAAIRDLDGLSQVDSITVTLMRRLGARMAGDYAPESRQALLQQYVSADIEAAGYPMELSAWPSDSGPVASFGTAQIPSPRPRVASAVALARQTSATVLETVPTDTAIQLVMAVPSIMGGVTAVVVAPKSRLFQPDPFARLLGVDIGPETEPPYTLRLRERMPTDTALGERWRREGSELHGDWLVRTGTGLAQAHVEVELRSFSALVMRGGLIVLLDLAIVYVLWMASVLADGGMLRWIRARQRTWGRSLRTRLSVALFAFFVIPAVAFATWSWGQLATDATRSREVLVRETLRAVDVPRPEPTWLPSESDRLDTPLFLYRTGELREASDPLYDDIAPLGRYLTPDAELVLAVRGEATDTRLEPLDRTTVLFGYRSFSDEGAPSTVVSAPARADELELGRRRRDLGVLVLFATAVGAIAALWLSGLAARELARPIGTLRTAALSIASGTRTPPLEGEPTIEFKPVFIAFRRMESDLNASRTALEEAQRRTAAVLRNVASGVVAVDGAGNVALANPRAETLIEGTLTPGEPFASVAPPELARPVEHFLNDSADERDLELSLEGQQLRVTLTRLARGGAVVTLDDVTELARAQRVLAWGEMARQVAHEIKNPLTPIRLGVQHLRRARADTRVDFDRVLEHNVNQILAEIDRLDEIARAFSRYGAAPEERRRAGRLDVAAIVREVVSLERMGEEHGLLWEEEGVDAPVSAIASADELKEVMLNVLENARNAQAKRVVVSVGTEERDGERRVVIRVRDDGRGIAPEVLPRIFEPHFSTSTSGSGLGLAISRQLVEGWGGTIVVESEPGEGAVVELSLRGG